MSEFEKWLNTYFEGIESKQPVVHWKHHFAECWNHQQKKIDVLTKALEFYGEKDNWKSTAGNRDHLICLEHEDYDSYTKTQGFFTVEVMVQGKRARQALKELEGME